MAKRPTRLDKLRESMAAACWRIKEEATLAEMVIVVVATGGRDGGVLIDFGSANPGAVRGVLEDAMEALLEAYSDAREDAAEVEDDEDEAE